MIQGSGMTTAENCNREDQSTQFHHQTNLQALNTLTITLSLSQRRPNDKLTCFLIYKRIPFSTPPQETRNHNCTCKRLAKQNEKAQAVHFHLLLLQPHLHRQTERNGDYQEVQVQKCRG